MKTSYRILKVFIFLFCVLSVKTGLSQNVGISATSGFTPDASAGLDVNYTNKGLLVPRVALTATNAAGPVTAPATSLLVYNTATAGTAPNNVVPGYYYWNGTAWMMLSTNAQATSSWFTTGNTGTSYPSNFLGTTDNFGLHFKTNNTHRFWLDSLGSVSVGVNPIFTAGNAREKFLVDAGNINYPTPTGAFNVISGKGYLDSYLQLNIQNTSPTAAASSDIVASNDAATETTNYVDMGINSSANTSTGVLGGANTAYLYGAGNDFAIGNGTTGKNLLFFTGGTASNERMRIDGNGNLGIGNSAPTQKVDITGNLKLSGAFMPGNTAGTAGYFLVSSGANAAPTWYNAQAYINTVSWVLTGNPGTTSTNFLGTPDNKPMRFRTNNTQRVLLDSLGNVAIGTSPVFSSSMEKLLVDAGTTSSFNVISGKGNLNNYLQLNIQNNNAGTAASSDVVATADNGNETANYVDMGINSSANTSAFFGAANDAYLYNAGGTVGGNFFIGTSTSGKSLGFLTGGGTSTNERMRIDGTTGNIGIGTTTPATKLHIFGANPLTLSGVVTGTNTSADSLLTITNGLVRKLPIATFASTGNDWSTTGNTGTTAGTNFIGTTDATDFVVKTNSTEKLRVSSVGGVTIGGTAFNSTNPEQLLVDAGSTSATPATSFNVISGRGYIDKYLQLNIQNTAPTASASSDVVASNDAATELTNYIDMGINSSAYSSTGILGYPNQAYLLATGNDFSIGNSTAGKILNFFTGGSATTNERMRIDGNGNVGIGTTNPSASLHVNGTLKLTGSAIGAATDSLLTITTNLVRKIPTATYVNTASTQTVTGAKTFSAATTFSGTATYSSAVAYPILVAPASGSITLSTVHHTVIIPSTSTYIVTLPTAASSTKRVYVIVNQTTAQTTIGSYISFTGAVVTTINGQTGITVQSDGINWYQIN